VSLRNSLRSSNACFGNGTCGGTAFDLHRHFILGGLSVGDAVRTLDGCSNFVSEEEQAEKYAELLIEAEALTGDATPKDIQVVLKKAAFLSPIAQEKIHKVMKSQTGTSLDALRKATKITAANGPLPPIPANLRKWHYDTVQGRMVNAQNMTSCTPASFDATHVNSAELAQRNIQHRNLSFKAWILVFQAG